MSLISIIQVITSSVNKSLSAIPGKVQRVINTGSSSITITYGSNTQAVAAGGIYDFLYLGSSWYVIPVSISATIEVPIGASLEWSGIDIPTSFMQENGAAVSRTTYSTLFGKITKSLGTATAALDSSYALFTLTGHGLATGDCISFDATTGTLPTGISVNTNYYAVYISANTFKVAASYATATAASPTYIGTTAGSGNHTILYNPWGISGSANFLLPDTRGLHIEGVGQQGTASWASSQYTGRLGHLIQDVIQDHGHLAGVETPWADASAHTAYFTTPSGTRFGRTGAIAAVNISGGVPRSSTKTAPARAGKYRIIKVA